MKTSFVDKPKNAELGGVTPLDVIRLEFMSRNQPPNSGFTGWDVNEGMKKDDVYGSMQLPFDASASFARLKAGGLIRKVGIHQISDGRNETPMYRLTTAGKEAAKFSRELCGYLGKDSKVGE